MSEELTADDKVRSLWERYQGAQAGKSHFTKLEKELKDELCKALNYDPDDPKPQPKRVLDPAGNPLFEVNVSYSIRADTPYLKKAYPAIWAEIERRTPRKSIKPVG